MVALHGSDLLAMASAAGLVGLGVALLGLRRRSGPAFVLALFALAWGAQILSIRLSFVVGEATPAGRGLALASQAFLLPLYLFLAHFAAIFPTRSPLVGRRWWLPLLAAPAAATLVAIALDPAAGLAGGGTSVWGWAPLLLLFVPFAGAQLFALARFAGAYLAAPSEAERRPLLLGTAALLVFLSYYVVYLLPVLQGGALAARLGPLGFPLFAASVLGALAGWAFVAARLVARAPRHHRRMLAAAALLPAASAVPGALALGPDLDLIGLWRLLEVALLYYAVARFQLFDLDLRLRAAARTLAPLAAGVAAWGLLLLAAPLAGAAPGDPALAATLLIPAALAALAVRAPLARAFDRQFPYVQATAEYLLRRKLEVYRAAVRAGAPAEQRDALARELRLQPAERRVLEASRGAPGAGLPARYRVEGVLAEGAFGPVLLAWDERVGERVVLKGYVGFAGAGALDSFAREARLLGALDHPAIVAARDVVPAGDDLYLALEHATGGSLEERLAARGALPVEEALGVAEQVLEGLARAHRQGVVHRDVKPANILFHRGQAKLADFGVAFDPVLDGALRGLQGAPGTLGWMAPEQARGEGAGPASDVHAVGAVLHRMLAGRHYLDLEGLGEQAVRRAIAERAPALPLPGVPAEVNALLARALAKDPARRPPDAAAMLREVQRARRALARAPAAGPSAAQRPSPAADSAA